MAFFGLTYLGPKHHFARSLHTRTLCDYSDRTLSECYARTEALQGKGTISIDELRILLSYVYNGLPPERELGLLQRTIDLDQRGPQLPGQGAEAGILLRVTLPQLLAAAAKVRTQIEEDLEFKRIAGVEEVANEFKSASHLQEHQHKHLRSHYNPQDKYVKPVITSHEIGWFTPAKVEQADGSSDEEEFYDAAEYDGAAGSSPGPASPHVASRQLVLSSSSPGGAAADAAAAAAANAAGASSASAADAVHPSAGGPVTAAASSAPIAASASASTTTLQSPPAASSSLARSSFSTAGQGSMLDPSQQRSSLSTNSSGDNTTSNTPLASNTSSPNVGGRELPPPLAAALALRVAANAPPAAVSVDTSTPVPAPNVSPVAGPLGSAPSRPPRPSYSRGNSVASTPQSVSRPLTAGPLPGTGPILTPVSVSRPLTAATLSANTSVRNSPQIPQREHLTQPAAAAAAAANGASISRSNSAHPSPSPSPAPGSRNLPAGSTAAAAAASNGSGSAATADPPPEPFTIKNLDTGETCDLTEATSVFPEVERAMTLKAFEASIAHASAQAPATAEPKVSNEEVAEKKKTLGFLSKIRAALHLNDDDASSSDKASAASASIKVKTRHRSVQELTDVRCVQTLGQHAGPVWTVALSTAGEYMATGGQDSIVRVWAIGMNSQAARELDEKLRMAKQQKEEAAAAAAAAGPLSPAAGHIEVTSVAQQPLSPASNADSTSSGGGAGGSAGGSNTPVDLPSLDDFNANSGSSTGTHPIVYPLPLRSYSGHKADVIDLAWSKANFLLSASIDKTVRLWHVSRAKCLCVFQHADFVTAVSFHPVEDRYFVSGSFDKKLRIWHIPEHRVVEWAQTSNIITAATFSPSGAMAVAGLYNGQVVFYQTAGLKYFTQVDARNRHGRLRKGKKVTGLQFSPDGSKMLVTTNDSRIRLYDMADYSMLAKFKGVENDELQIRAYFSADGQKVICGGENQHVFVWSAAEYSAEGGGAVAAAAAVGANGSAAPTPSNNGNPAAANTPANASLSTANTPSATAAASAILSPSSSAAASSSASGSKPDVKCDSYESFRAFPDTCTSAQFLPPASLRLAAAAAPPANAADGTSSPSDDANRVKHIIVAAGYGGQIKFFENTGAPKKCSRY